MVSERIIKSANRAIVLKNAHTLTHASYTQSCMKAQIERDRQRIKRYEEEKKSRIAQNDQIQKSYQVVWSIRMKSVPIHMYSTGTARQGKVRQAEEIMQWPYEMNTFRCLQMCASVYVCSVWCLSSSKCFILSFEPFSLSLSLSLSRSFAQTSSSSLPSFNDGIGKSVGRCLCVCAREYALFLYFIEKNWSRCVMNKCAHSFLLFLSFLFCCCCCWLVFVSLSSLYFHCSRKNFVDIKRILCLLKAFLISWAGHLQPCNNTHTHTWTRIRSYSHTCLIHAFMKSNATNLGLNEFIHLSSFSLFPFLACLPACLLTLFLSLSCAFSPIVVHRYFIVLLNVVVSIQFYDDARILSCIARQVSMIIHRHTIIVKRFYFFYILCFFIYLFSFVSPLLQFRVQTIWFFFH